MNGIRKSSPPPPLPGQPQQRNYYPYSGASSDDFQSYNQQGQQQYPLQPIGVQQPGGYEVVKSPGFGSQMQGPGLGHPQQPPATMYQQQQQRGMGGPGGSVPFYQPNNPSVSVRQRFPNPSQNTGMYMPLMYPPFGGQGGPIVVNPGMQGQPRMPNQQYNPGLQSTPSGMYQMPPQSVPSYNQTYNPPVFYNQQPLRPPTNPGPKQKKILSIVDPNSGEDVTASIMMKTKTTDVAPPDSDSRSTPVTEPPSAPSPQNEIAAQFAAAVAAKLYSHPGSTSQPGDVPGVLQSQDIQQHQPPFVTEETRAQPTVERTPPPVETQVTQPPPSVSHADNQPPVSAITVHTHSINLSNGDAPVIPEFKPADIQTDKETSQTTVVTSEVVPTELPPQSTPIEPVSAKSPVDRTINVSVTDSSASSTRETTPEVHIVPPTPVEKVAPDTDFKVETPPEPVTEATVAKKDKPKKRKDLNKKGEKIQGSEYDAYTDNTPTQEEQPSVTEEQPTTKPEVVVTEVKADVPVIPQVTPQVAAPVTTQVTAPAEETVSEKPVTAEIPATDDGVPQVEIKIEGPEAELEEGEIVDDDDEDGTMELRYKYQEDQWSPLNLEGKKHYDREFLLQFQYESAATSKPAGLPDIPDIVLDKPLNAGRTFNRELSAGNEGSDFDFTPKYVWSGPGGGGGSRSRGLPRQPSNQKNKNVGGPPPRQINLSISKDIELHKAKAAWKPGRMETKKESEEETDEPTEELYKKTRSILNKLTPQKFQILLTQMQALKIDSENKLKGVIDLVFEKAISEPNFSVAYANMCRCLSMFKVQSDSKPGEMVNFRAVLLTRCQREFEKDKSSEAAFVTKREEIEKCEDSAKKEELKQILQYEESKAKRRSLGNIRFIGELFKLKMLTENIMHDCVFKLLRTKDPENLECLCRLLSTIGKELDTDKAKPRMEQYFQQMSKIANDKKNSSRVRFMLQDVIDVRLNKWVPRRENNNPKTIDEIHKEVAQENQEKLYLSQQNQIQQKSQGRGGRRGGPPGQNQMGGADGWNTVGGARTPLKSVDRSIDPSKMKFSKQNVDESIQLGPGGGAGKFSGWGRGSTGGTSGRASMEKEKTNTPTNRFQALSKPDEESSRRYGGSSPARDVRGRGGFGRPPTLNARHSQESEREKAVAAAKAIGASQSIEGTHRERSRGRAPDVQPIETPTPPPSSSLVKALSADEMEKKTKAILDEYFQIHDLKEAITCVKELSAENHHHFVYNAMNHVLERSSQSRRQTGFLLHDLAKQSVISVNSYIKGLGEVLEFAEDLEIDIPKIWHYYGELISPMMQDGSVPLSFFKEASKPLIANNKAGILLAEILHDASQRDGHKKVAGLWQASGLHWSDFVPRNQVDQFLKDKDLEFTKGGDSVPTTPTTGLPLTDISAKLDELIATTKADNESVFDWIESNVDEPTTKRPKFIRALMTAVCNSAIKGEKGKERLEPKEISKRNDLLQKYLDHQPVSELQALYALQVLITRLEHPPGLLRSMFDTLYDDDIISEDAFFQWEKSEDEPEGKGAALKQAVQFFTWLKEAEDES